MSPRLRSIEEVPVKVVTPSAFSILLMAVLVATVNELPVYAQSEEVFIPHRTMWAAKRANVRAGPKESYAKVGVLEVGERVAVSTRIGDWFKLYSRPGQGRRFVFSALLTEKYETIPESSSAQPSSKTSTPVDCTIKDWRWVDSIDVFARVEGETTCESGVLYIRQYWHWNEETIFAEVATTIIRGYTFTALLDTLYNQPREGNMIASMSIRYEYRPSFFE